MKYWKNIRGYHGKFQISFDGIVKSQNRWTTNSKGVRQFYKGKELKRWIENGYWRVGWRIQGEPLKCEFVHILVAKHFVPNPKRKPEVNHIDGDKLNPHYNNLEWNTRKENAYHARHVLGTPGGNFKEVLDLETGIIYNSVKEAHYYKGFKHSYEYTVGMLNGHHKNKTNLILWTSCSSI